MDKNKMTGFYPMLNDVHDKAVKDLPLAECALFEHIWRKLIGWNQYTDTISIGQLVKETSASRATIIRLTKKLETKRWIIISRYCKDGRHAINEIAIPECPGIKSKLGWCQNDTRVVSYRDIQQTSSTKDLNTTTKPIVDADTSFTDDDLDRLTTLFQNLICAPSDKDKTFIAGLLKKHKVTYVADKLELLGMNVNIQKPHGWLVAACVEDYPLPNTVIEARQAEEQRKANIEIAATERAERQVRDDAIQAEREEMETFKAAMAPTERNELHQQALSQLGVMDNGMPMPDRAIIERENAIIKANNPNVLS